jgi:hypothetical protein
MFIAMVYNTYLGVSYKNVLHIVNTLWVNEIVTVNETDEIGSQERRGPIPILRGIECSGRIVNDNRNPLDRHMHTFIPRHRRATHGNRLGLHRRRGDILQKRLKKGEMFGIRWNRNSQAHFV